MTVALRPMTTGELLDRTFNIYRNKFALFAGISAVGGLFYIAALALLVVLGVTLPKYGAHFNPQATFATLGLYFLVLGLFYLVGASLVMGATIYAVSKAYLEQSVTISESYSKVSPLLGRIIWIVLSIIIRLIGMLILVYLVDCRRVTITSCYASKLVWRQTAKYPSPTTNIWNLPASLNHVRCQPVTYFALSSS